MQKIKFFILFFIVIILMLIYPNMVSATTIEATETTTTSTGKTVTWSYELDNNNNIVNLKCTNVSSISGELTIPSTIDGYTVVAIGNTQISLDNGAFEGCSGLTGITIPDTVKSIGGSAFKNCTGLKTVKLPDSVTEIKDNAFNSCSGITTITFSENVTSIGSNAFENCTGLTKITIPNSVTNIDSGAFSGCSGAKELILSNNLTKISNTTFKGCTGFTSVIIPESVTTIEGRYVWEGAFGECINLEKILIPDSVATIGENAFIDCDKLTIYGNDGQVSKTYAEANGINFKYISQWDESDVGDDITAPYVESILVPYSSVSDYYDSNSTTYIVPVGKVLIINVNFNENILATQVPTLIIKFGNGSNIELKEGTVSGSTIAYSYTIGANDLGTMTSVSFSGGNVTDEAGNEATLSCPELKVQYMNHYIYANGSAIEGDDNNNDNNNNNSSSNNNTIPKEDNTIATSQLPQTGLSIGVLITVIILFISCIFAYFKYNNLRGI